MPASVDRGVSHKLAASALRAMQDFLLDRGYELVDAARLSRLSAAQRNCREQTCMAGVHRALGADHVIAVQLRRLDAGTTVQARWNDAAFATYRGEAQLASDTS